MSRCIFFFFLFATLAFSTVFAQTIETKISPRLQEDLDQASSSATYFDIYVLLSDRVNVAQMDQQFYARAVSLEERTYTLINALRAKAALTQKPVLEFLNASKSVDQSSIKPYWITNAIFFKAQQDVIYQLAQRNDIEQIDLNGPILIEEGVRVNNGGARRPFDGRELGLSAIKAHKLWQLGYTGYGRLAMGMDTGINWQHDALRNRFRGNHYPIEESWYLNDQDPIIPTDCGSSDHGTHTMGTMVGLDQARRDTIGVAFGAQWIGSPNLCSSNTNKTIATFEWALDPDGNPATIDDMPDVINNSWYDPDEDNECMSLYRSTFNALEAAGIAVVFSAGNEGPDSLSITSPKNINTTEVNVFCVGNVNGNVFSHPLSNSSSRGPSICGGNGSLLIKPEVVAPGSSVRSSVGINSYDTYSGTSMAAPHVSGAILLLKEAFPYLTGTEIKLALYYSATDLGPAGEDNLYGNGMINCETAFNYLLSEGHIPVSYANDAAAVEILNVDDRTLDPQIIPAIIIQNKGDSTLTQLWVSYSYDGSITGSIQWTGNLSYLEKDTVFLPFEVLDAGEHFLEISLSDPNNVQDERIFNDFVNKSFVIDEVFEAASLNICKGENAALSSVSSGNGFFQWYDQPVGGVLLDTQVIETGNLFEDTSFYYEWHQRVHTAEPNNDNGTGRYFSSTNRHLIFDCYYPFVLKSVLVYADSAGDRTIELRNSFGAVLESKTVNMQDGENRVMLDFPVPIANDLQLGVSGRADMYRNSSGLSYPYVVPGILSIKQANTDAPTKYYYFYYDWEISFTTAPRVPYHIIVVDSVLNGDFEDDAGSVLTVQFTDNTPDATSWLWDFGDGNTSTQQNPAHFYNEPGTYEVTLVVSNNASCQDTVQRVIDVGPSVGIYEAENMLTFMVFPNVTKSRSSVHIDLKQPYPISLTLIDLSGKTVQTIFEGPAKQVREEVSLADLSPGMYLVKLSYGNNRAFRKLFLY